VVAARHTIGYEHSFTHEVRDLMEALAADRDPIRPSTTRCRSSTCWTRSSAAAKSGSWTTV
jgi:hypothetical protein